MRVLTLSDKDIVFCLPATRRHELLSPDSLEFKTCVESISSYEFYEMPFFDEMWNPLTCDEILPHTKKLRMLAKSNASTLYVIFFPPSRLLSQPGLVSQAFSDLPPNVVLSGRSRQNLDLPNQGCSLGVVGDITIKNIDNLTGRLASIASSNYSRVEICVSSNNAGCSLVYDLAKELDLDLLVFKVSDRRRAIDRSHLNALWYPTHLYFSDTRVPTWSQQDAVLRLL